MFEISRFLVHAGGFGFGDIPVAAEEKQLSERPLSFFLPYSLGQIFPELLVAGAFGRVGRSDTSAVQVRIDFLAALGNEGIIKIGLVFVLALKLEL